MFILNIIKNFFKKYWKLILLILGFIGFCILFLRNPDRYKKLLLKQWDNILSVFSKQKEELNKQENVIDNKIKNAQNKINGEPKTNPEEKIDDVNKELKEQHNKFKNKNE